MMLRLVSRHARFNKRQPWCNNPHHIQRCFLSAEATRSDNNNNNNNMSSPDIPFSKSFSWQDPFLLRETLLTSDEIQIWDSMSSFCQSELLPTIVHNNAKEIPVDMKLLGEMGMLGCTIPTDYGGAGLNYTSYGLITTELEKIDSAYRSSVSVQSSLVMYPIYAFASSEQIKHKYLPKLATGEFIGCFGLTEPNHGSDPSSMETKSTWDAATNEYVLNGSKHWITNSPIADVFIIWAKHKDNNKNNETIKGYIVEKDTPGLSSPIITNKGSLKASTTGSIFLDNVRVPAEHQLQVSGLKGPFSCLNHARFGIAWGALGAAEACLHIARNYTLERHQFGKPLASTQLIQVKLADMCTKLHTARLACYQVGRLMEETNSSNTKLAHPNMISIVKRNSCLTALDIVRTCRDMLGGNGISNEYHIMRHLVNLEAVNTYEGTADIHALILGRAITGIPAF